MTSIKSIAKPVEFARALEGAATSLSLTVLDMGALATTPGARHWHLRRDGRGGTLEVTHDPRNGTALISYRDNRVGDGWVVEAEQQLAALLESNA